MDEILPQDTPTKQCTICKKCLPVNSDSFYRNKSSKDGFVSQCKVCLKAYDRLRYENNKEKRHEWKIQYYQEHRTQLIEREKKRYRENKEKKAEYDRQYRERNRGRIKSRRAEYYKNNKVYFYIKSRENYLAHKEEHHKRIRKYNHSPLGRMTRRLLRQARRAREVSAEGSYTSEQIQEQKARQKSKCYWCHAKLGTGKNAYHIDHIVPLSRGGSNDISNIVITCPPCNQKKNDKLPHEWTEGGRLL